MGALFIWVNKFFYLSNKKSEMNAYNLINGIKLKASCFLDTPEILNCFFFTLFIHPHQILNGKMLNEMGGNSFVCAIGICGNSLENHFHGQKEQTDCFLCK